MTEEAQSVNGPEGIYLEVTAWTLGCYCGREIKKASERGRGGVEAGKFFY